jgi:hypothetical protein
MENLVLDTIGSLIKGPALSSLTNIIGANSEDATKKGVITGASAMLAALSQTAKTPVGAAGLQQLMSGINPRILDDVVGYLQNPAVSGGGSILQQFLGGDVAGITSKVARASGLGPDIVGRLLPVLAPIVISAVTRGMQSQGIQTADLPKFLADQAGFLKTLTPGLMGFLERIDANDDGSILDDLGRLGERLFGGK